MVKVNLSGSELVRLGLEESQPNCDTIWCESCAEVHIWTEAEKEVFNTELCTECFYEVTDGLK